METLKQRLLEHIADLLDEPTFDLDMRLRDCIDPLPNDQSELHLLMTDAAFKVFCNYFGKEDTTKQCAINGVGNNEVELAELKELYTRKCLQKRLLEKELDEANKLLIDNGLKPNPY